MGPSDDLLLKEVTGIFEVSFNSFYKFLESNFILSRLLSYRTYILRHADCNADHLNLI